MLVLMTVFVSVITTAATAYLGSPALTLNLVRATTVTVIVITASMLMMVITTAAVIIVPMMLVAMLMAVLMGMCATITVAMLRHMSHTPVVVILATMSTGAAFRMISIILSTLYVSINMSKAAHFTGTITHIL